MKVTCYYGWDELPEEFRQKLGYRPDWFVNYLVIEWADGTVQIETDAGEPEDQTFIRDWSWVESALIKAYEEGKNGN